MTLVRVLLARGRCLFVGHTPRFVRAATAKEHSLFGGTMHYRCATCPALLYSNELPPHLRSRRPSVSPPSSIDSLTIGDDVEELREGDSGPTVA